MMMSVFLLLGMLGLFAQGERLKLLLQRFDTTKYFVETLLYFSCPNLPEFNLLSEIYYVPFHYFHFLFRINGRYSSDSDSISSGCSAGRHCLYQLYSQSECLRWQPTSAGTCRNLARLLNFSFTFQQLASLGFLIVSVGVDLGLSLH